MKGYKVKGTHEGTPHTRQFYLLDLTSLNHPAREQKFGIESSTLVIVEIELARLARMGALKLID